MDVEVCSILDRLGIHIVWFDSLGAKCACIAIESSEGFIVIDPGAAEMQPSYPLSLEEKFELRRRAIQSIEKYMHRACAVIVTHYHYDHHVLPGDVDILDPRKYWLTARLLILKNPNMYINESQWDRARLFLSELLKLLGKSLDEYITEPQQHEFRDPVEELNIALSKNFGDYQSRREELLKKGRRWFEKLCSMWSSKPWIKEIDLGSTKIVWGDGRVFVIGGVEVEVLKPWFHGLEYDRTGWITPLIIRKNNYRIFYSSDVMGPEIEDYAEFIAKLRPDIVVLDGPPTYLYPYMLNRINLRRTIDNAITILSSKPGLVIYDHHLLREPRWRLRVQDVFREAEKQGVTILTAAECLGKTPLIDVLGGRSSS